MNWKRDKTAGKAAALVAAAFILILIFASPLGAKAATATTEPAYANQITIKVEGQSFYVKNGLFICGEGFFTLICPSTSLLYQDAQTITTFTWLFPAIPIIDKVS